MVLGPLLLKGKIEAAARNKQRVHSQGVLVRTQLWWGAHTREKFMTSGIEQRIRENVGLKQSTALGSALANWMREYC